MALTILCQAVNGVSAPRVSGNGHVQTPGKGPVVLPKPRRESLVEAPGLIEEPRPAPGSLGVVDETHRRQFGPIKVPRKILMGGGPTNVHPRILAAQSLPMLGYFQPPLLEIMNEIQTGLRYLMQTESRYICLLGASGHAGMEAGIANLTEPGDKVIIINQGVWGWKAAEMARRYGGDVVEHKMPPGVAVSKGEIEQLLCQHKPSMLFMCHGESCTGVLNPLEGVGDLCHRHGALLQVDAVCSIAGTPLYTDAWGIDCLYAGSQKCLSAPPGATPFMLSERAVHKLRNRRSPPTCYLFDMELNGRYWHWWDERSIHNTGLITNWYAMREALAIVAEEGLEQIWARHRAMHELLWQGLSSLGLSPLVEDPSHRLPSVNAIKVPEGVDSKAVIDYAMNTYALEIATGLPPIGPGAWRIGLLGYNANAANVALVVTAFREGLAAQGYPR